MKWERFMPCLAALVIAVLAADQAAAQGRKIVRELGEHLLRHGDGGLKSADDVLEAPLRRAAHESHERLSRKLTQEGVAKAARQSRATSHLAKDAGKTLSEPAAARMAREMIEAPATVDSLRTLRLPAPEREALESILGRSLSDGLQQADLNALVKRAAQRNPTGWPVAFEKYVKPNWKLIVGSAAGIAILAFPDQAFSAAGDLTEWGAEALTRAGIRGADQSLDAVSTGITRGVEQEWHKVSVIRRALIIAFGACLCGWIFRHPLQVVGRAASWILRRKSRAQSPAQSSAQSSAQSKASTS